MAWYPTSIYTEHHYPLLLILGGLLLAWFHEAGPPRLLLVAAVLSVVSGVLLWVVGRRVCVWAARSPSHATCAVMLGQLVIEYKRLSAAECASLRHTGTQTAMWSRPASEVVRQLRYRSEQGRDCLLLDLLTLGRLSWAPLTGWRKLGMEEGEHLLCLFREPKRIEPNQLGTPPRLDWFDGD